MNRLLALLILSLFSVSGACQDLTIVKGRITNAPYSQLSIQSLENPVTGTRDLFKAQLSDYGEFRIEAEIITSQIFNLIVDDIIVYQLFLCPNTETIINVDTSGFNIKGPTEDFYEWREELSNDYLNKYSSTYLENQGFNKDSVIQIIQYMFDWKDEAISQYQKTGSKYSLSTCEYNHFKDVINYAVYTFLWSDLMQRGYSIESDLFDFWNNLPLDDAEAITTSLDYNRALDTYIFWKLRLENHWYDFNSFNYSSDEFAVKFYEQIIAELKNNDVRNSALTRNVCSSLFRGTTSADYLYERYLKDCSDTSLKRITARYYKKNLSVKGSSKPQIRIDTLNFSLFDKLKEFEGKVLYLDFWASWCSPCLTSLPHTRKIQEKYSDAPFEVIYVNVSDNIGSFETIVKKLDLKGTLIYLDKEESNEVLNFLDAEGIPHYVLIDKDGSIVEGSAPGPESGAIIDTINRLLE